MEQDMEGDITWVAPITYDDLNRLLDNPSADRVASVIQRAERGVWPLISQIDTRCLIEFALDDCIRQVRSLSLVGDLVCCCCFGVAGERSRGVVLMLPL